jgi:dihydrolipoamide dehydrogenase
LLHGAKVITEAEEMAHFGVKFSKPEVDIDALRGWKESVVNQLTGGLKGLAKARKVQVVNGYGTFTGPNMIEVDNDGAKSTVSFDQCIIAAGSEPVTLPFIPHDDPRVIDSTGALELEDIPERLLVLGGGIIGLEMGTVYDALGSKVTVVEFMDQIIPGADKDIVKPLQKRIEGRYEAILTIFDIFIRVPLARASCEIIAHAQEFVSSEIIRCLRGLSPAQVLQCVCICQR